MTNEELKVTLLKKFMDMYPSLVHRMRNTMHSASDTSLCPYHLEDCVWSHTMMVLKAIDLNLGNDINKYAAVISAITHDVGKTIVRGSHKLGRVNFWGHEKCSMQYTIDFVYDLLESGNDPILSNKESFAKILYRSMFAVNKHIEIFSLEKEKFLDHFCNNTGNGVVAINLAKADLDGSFKLSQLKKLDIDILDLKAKKVSDRKPDAIMMCGIPGSGKDYNAVSFEGTRILSYDDIRIEQFLFNNKDFDGEDLYKKAFIWCRDRNINLDVFMKEKIKKTKEDGLIPCISNTNLNKKARAKILSVLKSALNIDPIVDCYYVVTKLQVAIERDINRASTDKTVGKDVIIDMAYRQDLPSYDEGFDKINIVFN